MAHLAGSASLMSNESRVRWRWEGQEGEEATTDGTMGLTQDKAMTICWPVLLFTHPVQLSTSFLSLILVPPYTRFFVPIPRCCPGPPRLSTLQDVLSAPSWARFCTWLDADFTFCRRRFILCQASLEFSRTFRVLSPNSEKSSRLNGQLPRGFHPRGFGHVTPLSWKSRTRSYLPFSRIPTTFGLLIGSDLGFRLSYGLIESLRSSRKKNTRLRP